MRIIRSCSPPPPLLGLLGDRPSSWDCRSCTLFSSAWIRFISSLLRSVVAAIFYGWQRVSG